MCKITASRLCAALSCAFATVALLLAFGLAYSSGIAALRMSEVCTSMGMLKSGNMFCTPAVKFLENGFWTGVAREFWRNIDDGMSSALERAVDSLMSVRTIATICAVALVVPAARFTVRSTKRALARKNTPTLQLLDDDLQ